MNLELNVLRFVWFSMTDVVTEALVWTYASGSLDLNPLLTEEVDLDSEQDFLTHASI